MAKFLSTLASENTQRISKQKVNIYDTLPSHIVNDSENFIQLLQDYYEFLNERGMPVNVITNMVKNNDIDRVDEEFINSLMTETMPDLPLEPSTNRKMFYKRVVDFYRTKGTIEGIRVFFRVFFNDAIELYYPRDDTFTMGVNRWDSTLKKPQFDGGGNLVGYTFGGWVNNKGMLSTTQYLTDGRYYQPYSYVIKSGLNISKWQYVYNKVCHPTGFVFYGEIAIFIELLDTNDNLFRMPTDQPGFTRPSELEQQILIELLKDTPYTESIEILIKKIIKIHVDFRPDTTRKENHRFDKYFSLTDIRQYYEYNVRQIDSVENLPGTYLTRPFFLTTERGDLFLTEDSDTLQLDGFSGIGAVVSGFSNGFNVGFLN